MTTTTHNRNYLARIATEIRMATTPSLALSAKSLDEQRWELLNDARACRVLADSAKAAGEIGSAAEYVAKGRAILRTLREMEGR
jgi:hypothetical protein